MTHCDNVKEYKQKGFTVLTVYSKHQIEFIEDFAKNWVIGLLSKWTSADKKVLLLENYHNWTERLRIDHENIFKAHNRHKSPGDDIKSILINDKIRSFMQSIGLENFKLWDEGLGWLAFRFIRPGAGDGYPFSRKEWGVAKNVVSCWIPIIGFEPEQTLSLVPESHLKDYECYLPINSKFTKDEYRLVDTPPESEVYNPYMKKRQMIIFHPRTLHSEDVVEGNITRLSLEFRLVPT